MNVYLIPVNLFEQGLVNVVIARKTPEGDIAVSAFIVDIFCLGVKDAFFRLFSEYEYEHRVKYGFIQTQGCGFEEIDESCAKKLLEGAVAYAEGLGFKTHPDYKNAANIFKGVDGGACSVTYVYGKDGKPLYIRGPYESLAHAEKIIDTLQKNAAMADSIMLLEATLPTIIFRRNNTASGRAIRSSLQNPPGCQATCFQQIGYAIMYRQ